MFVKALFAATLALALLGGGEAQARKGDLNVFLRGGVGGFTGDLGGLSTPGPVWGATLNLQPFNALGFELGYEGSRNGVSDGRFDDAPTLLRNGVSGLLKVAPPLVERVKPFVGVGLGASYVSVRGDGRGLYESDLMEEVPLVAGLEFNSGTLTTGVRATYRALVDEGFAERARVQDAPGGGLLDASVTLGGRF